MVRRCAPPQKTTAPTMFPARTGIILLSQNWEAEISAPQSIPTGSRNMLATLCSRPRATNVMIGIHSAAIFPGAVCADCACTMAIATNQFAPMPLTNAALGAKEAFPSASAAALAATTPLVGKMPPAQTMLAIVSEPAKFPRKDKPNTRPAGQARSPEIGGSDWVSMLPVSSSLPERVIIDKPTGNTAPLINATAPGAMMSAQPPPTTVISSPPQASIAPPRKLLARI
mmetsp:Transcript_33237/g.91589  ORF Transcript_33237/g.91589 Transcript_33237/m.91589 type:complete len:228 (-) Transcript_33237:328-1011(-)